MGRGVARWLLRQRRRRTLVTCPHPYAPAPPSPHPTSHRTPIPPRSKSRLQEFFLGSVTSYCVHHSKRPVLVHSGV